MIDELPSLEPYAQSIGIRFVSTLLLSVVEALCIGVEPIVEPIAEPTRTTLAEPNDPVAVSWTEPRVSW